MDEYLYKKFHEREKSGYLMISLFQIGVGEAPLKQILSSEFHSFVLQRSKI